MPAHLGEEAPTSLAQAVGPFARLNAKVSFDQRVSSSSVWSWSVDA